MRKSIPVICFLIFNLSLQAQKASHSIHIQTSNNGVVKDGTAQLIYLGAMKEGTDHAVILTTRDMITNAREITLYINRKDNADPFKYTFQNNEKYVIQSKNKKTNLIAIPYGYIKLLPNKETFVEPVFIGENRIHDYFENTSDDDVKQLKKAMEAWSHQ